jgi:hypothetical protein
MQEFDRVNRVFGKPSPRRDDAVVAWHVVSNVEKLRRILDTMEIPLTKNLQELDVPLSHVNLLPYEAADYSVGGLLILKGHAWILELDIPKRLILLRDPYDDDGALRKNYGVDWAVSSKPIPILEIARISYISNVQSWEMGSTDVTQELSLNELKEKLSLKNQ